MKTESELPDRSTVALAAVAALLLASCFPARVAPRATAVASFPIEVSNNLPLVPLRVNGSEAAWFVVDTGAEATVIDAEWANSLGLEIEEGVEVSTTGGTLEADLVRGAVLTVDGAERTGIELRDVTLLVIPLAGLEAGLGRAVGGILGADLFARFVVEFDYAARVLRLYEPLTYRPDEGGEVLAVRIEDGTPFVQATIEGPDGQRIDAELLLDTGASGALTLYTPFVNRHRLLESSGAVLPLTSAAILAGGAQRYLGRTSRLHFGSVQLSDVLTTLAQDEEGDLADSTSDGLIGGDLLGRFTLVVDYSRHQVVLKPGAGVARPTEFDASGLSLGAVGPDFRTLRVRLVIAGSPAEEAGIEPGDVLLAIDGRPVAGNELEEVRLLLRRVGEQHTLTLRRGESTIERTISTRRLI